ncbi:MAG: arginine--tRNA ligase, partial [Candidatus Paceibacterota bacterium]
AIRSGDEYGKNKILEGKRVIIEYTNANPFKEFHIGHLMNNTVGESLSRLLEFGGAEVRRANYQGDVGLHIAKTLWGMKKSDESSPTIESLAKAYAQGSDEYGKSETAQKEIIEINKKIYEQSDEEINKRYTEGKKVSISYFEELYARLGTVFDDYYFESTTASIGTKMVTDNLGSIFKESQGAVIFPAEEYDEKLHTRVFITKEGLPTYEAKDLGLAKLKYSSYPYDMSFVITGNEVKEYFKVVYTALAQIEPELAARTTHLPHGMLRLKNGKMSSRTGDVITASALLDDVYTRVLQKMKDTELSHKEKERIGEEVTVGAVKYSILHQALGRDVVFDFDTSLSFEGNSGPYLQYTYARTQSLLRKAEEKGKETQNASLHEEKRKEVSDIERLAYRFPEVVTEAMYEREPHHIATYLFSLAHAFNAYYSKNKILGSENEAYRLALTASVAQILKNGLWILGMKAPERM